MKRIQKHYEKVAFSEETGYMLNNLTLNVSDKEASKAVEEVKQQLRFQLLWNFIFVGGILQLFLIVLKVMGNWYEFLKISTGVVIFISYLLL